MAKEVKLLRFDGMGQRKIRDLGIVRGPGAGGGRSGNVFVYDHPEMEQMIEAYLKAGFRLVDLSNGNGVIYVLLER